MAEEPSGRGEGAAPTPGDPGPPAVRSRGAEVSRWQEVSGDLVRVLPRFWVMAWIFLFAVGQWQWALFVMLMTAPALALVRGPRGSVRRQVHRDRHRAERRALYDRRVVERDMRRQGHEEVGARPARPRQRWQWVDGSPSGTWRVWAPTASTPDAPAGGPPAGAAGGPPAGAAGGAPPAGVPGGVPDPLAPERSLAAAVTAARTGVCRLDPDALELVDELEAALRPMLARARHGGIDAVVRRDLESIATEHLPETIRAYQHLPPGYAHEHRAADGRTPAEELRSQLTVLVEGCAPLRDAVHGADVARQRELGRFLEAKFRRSDLDL